MRAVMLAVASFCFCSMQKCCGARGCLFLCVQQGPLARKWFTRAVCIYVLMWCQQEHQMVGVCPKYLTGRHSLLIDAKLLGLLAILPLAWHVVVEYGVNSAW